MGFETTSFAAEKVFDLRQTVEFALQNNGELKALREEKGMREAGKIRAGLFPNPVFEMDGTTGELTGSPFENSLWVGVSQEFLTAGKRGKRMQVAEKEIESFDRQVGNSGRLLIEEVQTTFYDLLLAEKRVDLAKRSVALNNQLLDITRQRFEAGDVPELEVNLARVEVARSEGRKAEAERELYPAKARLLALMGFSQAEEASFNGSLEGKPLQRAGGVEGLAPGEAARHKGAGVGKGKKRRRNHPAQAGTMPNITAGLGYQRRTQRLKYPAKK
jgi:cobalt-zinc-cadmium efflux system outer membrane protein